MRSGHRPGTDPIRLRCDRPRNGGAGLDPSGRSRRTRRSQHGGLPVGLCASGATEWQGTVAAQPAPGIGGRSALPLVGGCAEWSAR